MGLSLAVRGHAPQCQVLWGSALLPSGYSEDCAGKIEHLPFSLSFYFIALKLVSSQFSINKIFTTPKMDNIPKNVYKILVYNGKMGNYDTSMGFVWEEPSYG